VPVATLYLLLKPYFQLLEVVFCFSALDFLSQISAGKCINTTDCTTLTLPVGLVGMGSKIMIRWEIRLAESVLCIQLQA
jgi:hypothetical protein